MDKIIITPEDIANAPKELSYCDVFKLTDNPMHIISNCGFGGILKYLNIFTIYIIWPLIILLPISIIYTVYSLVTKTTKRTLKVIIIILLTTYLGYIINTFIIK